MSAPCKLPDRAEPPLRGDWAASIAAINWVPDLAEDIGSRQWWRGMATLLALCALALAFWPNFSPRAQIAALRIAQPGQGVVTASSDLTQSGFVPPSLPFAGAPPLTCGQGLGGVTTPLRIRGVITGSIYRSARTARAPIAAIQQYLQVLDQHLSLDTGIEPGDTFDMIVACPQPGRAGAETGELLFAGLERAGQPKAQLLRWGAEGQFYEASGMGAHRTGLLMPVVGRMTSSFGSRRHPILGYTRLHAGVDFAAAFGAPIYAVGDGVVTYAGWHGGHGNYVRLDHGGGFDTGYAHMSRIAVQDGARVRAGQVIGYVGSTGLSTGPHLHYELYRSGLPVDPLQVRFTVANQVDAAELAAFRTRLARLRAIAPAGLRPNLAVR